MVTAPVKERDSRMGSRSAFRRDVDLRLTVPRRCGRSRHTRAPTLMRPRAASADTIFVRSPGE